MNLNADKEVTREAASVESATDISPGISPDISQVVQFDRFERRLSECLVQITELQAANRVLLEQLSKARAEAFEAIEAKNIFLAGMSSEIQRHLTGQAGSDQSARSDKPLSGVKVLIAEDSPDNQMLMRQYLGIAGAEVEMADNGQEAIEKALSGSHNVVIMDVMMPVCDGYEATRTLRAKGYNKPIIALTAHALKEQREQSLKEGCNEHLVKPINRPLLISTIAHYAAEGAN